MVLYGYSTDILEGKIVTLIYYILWSPPRASSYALSLPSLLPSRFGAQYKLSSALLEHAYSVKRRTGFR